MNHAPAMMEEGRRTLSDEGRARLLSRSGESLFLAGWERTLFIHFEVDAARLQRDVPFPLDLYEGRAHVSLVAFTMRNMRFSFGGPALSLLLKPIATHEFLNVRTYVRHGEERGIYFLTEWLSNWLSVQLGPLLYGLPYHHAKIRYCHDHENGRLSGNIVSRKTGKQLAYEARCGTGGFAPSRNGSLDEFLTERYTAFTACGSTRRFFRIWHPPWPQIRADVSVLNNSLLLETWPWFAGARLSGANYSPGFPGVWMGRAHRIKKSRNL